MVAAGSWIDLDGVVHVAGACCDDGERCQCGGVRHRTGGYNGMVSACERCDAGDFKPGPAPATAA